MIALVKKKNITFETHINGEAEVIAIKGEYPRPSIVYSIRIGDFIVTSKNFSRKTWSSEYSANKALDKILSSIPHIKPFPKNFINGKLKTNDEWYSYAKPIMTFDLRE